MKIGLIGLGQMGGNMAERIRRGGHEVIGYDRIPIRRVPSIRWKRWSKPCRRRARSG